jgi:hypothetical protein
MILASHGIIASSILQVDPDWLAYYNRVIAAGGSLSTTEQNATKTLVADLKAYGIWTKMKAIYPMVGASSAACAQNLKSSSFTGTFSTGWTFASTGVTPNGTSSFMNTNFIESGNLSLNSGHLSIYSRTQNSNLESDIGNITFVNPNVLSYSTIYASFNSTSSTFANQSNDDFAITNNNSKGFFISNKTAANQIIGFIRNIKTTGSRPNSALSLIPNYIGARNFNGVADNISRKENAFASMGDGLTDTEASNFYTAVQAFQTTLSRQV